MNFIQALPRGSQPRFKEGSALYSNRDDSAVARNWEKNEVGAAQLAQIMQSVGKLSSDVNRIKRRKLPFIPSAETFYPFKIYQPSNIPALVGQTLGMVSETAGALVPCLIVNTPTNLSANPPQINVGETWRFWCVRSGYVEMRSIYGFDSPNDDPLPQFMSANFSLPIVPQWTDFAGNLTGNKFWTTGQSSDDDVTTYPTVIPIVLGGTTATTGSVTALIWIQCIPDTSNSVPPTATIQGVVGENTIANVVSQTGFGILNTGSSPLPGNNGTVPLGIAGTDPTGNFAVNFVFDNIRNRFPCGNGNWSGMGVAAMNMRGTVKTDSHTADSSSTPTDLGKQVFYPGDAVWFYSYNSDTEVVSHNGIYQFTGIYPAYAAVDDNGTPQIGTDANFTRLFDVQAITPGTEPP